MNVDVVKYNERNGAQIRDAHEILETIVKGGVDDVKIIVDIGCGTGNVTKILAGTIPHEKIFALDVDPGMVDLAVKANEGDATIDFSVQDISAPWEELGKTLTDLEGKVDLVWSNRVLHWIEDHLRHRAAENILRLLRPGGRCFVNTTLTKDFNLSLPAEQREENEKVIKIPSKETQHEWWTDYFTKAGLSDLTVTFSEKYWDFECNQIFKDLAEYAHFWKRYIRPEVPPEKHDQIIEGYKDLILKVLGHPVGHPYDKSLDEMTTYYYGQYRIIGVKK